MVGAQPPNPPQRGVTELQILQYSDWHGQLDPISIFGEGTFGGAAQLSTYFKQDEANNPNTLIITGGDAQMWEWQKRFIGYYLDRTAGTFNFDTGSAGFRKVLRAVLVYLLVYRLNESRINIE